MTYPTTWQPTNEQYLTAALTWLRLRLQHLITPAETIDLTEATKTITTLETADALPPSSSCANASASPASSKKPCCSA